MKTYEIQVACIVNGKPGTFLHTNIKIQKNRHSAAVKKAELMFPGKAVKVVLQP